MDEVDTPSRHRRPKAKTSFQMEIESKLRERRAKGLTADLTSEESADDAADDMMEFGTLRRHDRPSSATRRGDHASMFPPDLGATMRTQDIDRHLNRRTPTNFDEEDDEIASTLKNKPSGGLGLSQRKTPTPKEGLFSRKTPTSPQTAELSKEDIIFGRKTPTQSKGKSGQGGSDLPNLGGQQPWQPPNFRNISPSAEQRLSPAGSQGRRTPGLDSSLDPISESRETQRTPRLARDRQGSPGQMEESPRSDRPIPRARGRSGEKEPERPTRTTPTLDLFGKSRRDSSFEVEKELKEIEEKQNVEERLQRRAAERKAAAEDRKTPTRGRKSPGPGSRFSPSPERKTLEDTRDRGFGRKSPAEDRAKQQQQKKEKESSSLLDFLTGDLEDKPRAKDRPARRSKIPKDEHKDIYDIGEVPMSTQQAVAPVPRGRHFKDDSSLCEEVKEDPNASTWRQMDDSGDARKATQRSDRQKADYAIDKIAQEQQRIDFKPLKKVRPVSAQAKVQHRPKPRYGTLPGQTSKEASMPEYHSTLDIRDAVYEEWYRSHIKAAKVDKKEKQKKEEEEAQKKKQEEEEKKTEAMLAYKSWVEKKKEMTAKERVKKKEEEEKKKEKEQQEREDKRVEAEVTFKSWKEKKDEYLKGKAKEQKMSEREKKEKEAEAKAEKEKDRQTAFHGWKSRKDVELKRKVKDEKKQKTQEETNMLATQRKKEEEAQQRYEEWLYDKEKQDHRKKIESRQIQMSGAVDYRPPWSPANCTVPFGR
ncbi:uncharacterized protein LOC143275507 isoform X2 [Babylonia areolata]|uniref:uncharacterized protein LOC143275507 isoform X2 n=1 Tax=Babylonia areolata TaxID=304850 RepID=UPI003FCFE1EE